MLNWRENNTVTIVMEGFLERTLSRTRLGRAAAAICINNNVLKSCQHSPLHKI